jgi:hypothetical protein
MKINITLDCGHEIVWHDQPRWSGSDLPFVGRNAWCNVCNTDRNIVDIFPERFVVDIITLNEKEAAMVFYDFQNGIWGYQIMIEDIIDENNWESGFESVEEIEDILLRRGLK